MKKNIKMFVVCMTILALVVGLSCAANAVKKIRFVTDETDPHSKKVYEGAANAYEALHPDVKIEYEYISFEDQIPMLVAAISTGEVPGVQHVNAYGAYGYADYFLDLSPIVEEIGGEGKFFTNSLLKKNGKVIAIPYGGCAGVLWVRTDLLSKQGLGFPDTWEEWLTAAEKLTVDFQGDGRIDRYGQAIPLGRNRWTAVHLWWLMWENGATMFDENLNVTFDSPETVEALKFLKKMSEFSPPDSPEYSYYDSINAFTSGAVAMTYYAGRLLPALAQYAPQLEDDTLAIPVPKKKFRINQWGWDSYVVFKDCDYPEETVDFVKYLTATDWAIKFGLSVPGHIIPGVRSLAEKLLERSPLLIRHKRSYQTILNSLDFMMEEAREAGCIQNGKFVPEKGRLNPYMTAIVGAKVCEDVVQKHVLGGMSAEEAVAWGAKKMREIVEREKRAR